ncbi:uncharacterized protein LOC141900417 [Tubulanus polymorphus]|uniref:uncharacterized protein LOC141900417 n=1 Tax=Tubulanus polymorphus TaxID=672921 RepID=UPI003DA41D55
MTSPSPPPVDIRKALFQSPHAVADDDQVGVSENMMNILMIDHDTEASLYSLQKDLHKQRLKHIKEKLKDVAEDNWRYPTIDSLIGLNPASSNNTIKPS